jgi:hypothetical protein
MHQAAIALQVGPLHVLAFFSLYTYQNKYCRHMAIMVNGNAYSNYGLVRLDA